MGACIAAFDRAAPSYDRTFTETKLGRELRSLVWERLAALFAPGDRVLELNCGTGEDACWLASRGVRVTATDGSKAMLSQAEQKARERGLEASIAFHLLDLAEPNAPLAPLSLDGALSNFGGLNCVADLRPLAEALARWVRPGAPVVLVVMGPLCLWELATSMMRLDVKQAFRRLSKDGPTARLGNERIHITYRWPAELARAFEPCFRVERLSALGWALPPSLWSSALEKRPRLLAAMARAERLLRHSRPLAHLSDHYVLELRRVS
jgi:ubiquinone/menaquinone biosynthesis C-methylase UbiE